MLVLRQAEGVGDKVKGGCHGDLPCDNTYCGDEPCTGRRSSLEEVAAWLNPEG